jgi:hypothetical protein
VRWGLEAGVRGSRRHGGGVGGRAEGSRGRGVPGGREVAEGRQLGDCLGVAQGRERAGVGELDGADGGGGCGLWNGVVDAGVR